MKLIEPKVELWSELGVTPEQHIARCARVCYGNENKKHTQEQDKKLVDGLVKPHTNGDMPLMRKSNIFSTRCTGPYIVTGKQIGRAHV